MKGFIVFGLLVTLACSSGSLEALEIGQSCTSSSPFVTTSFDVTPYPPTAGVQLNVNMAGTFSSTQFISDIAVRTSYKGGAWTYKYIDINQSFTYGQIYTFTFTLTAGNAVGLYDTEILLEKKQGSGLSCWSFTYHI